MLLSLAHFSINYSLVFFFGVLVESDIIMACAENEDMFSWSFVTREYFLVRKNQPALCVWWYFGNAYRPLPCDPLLELLRKPTISLAPDKALSSPQLHDPAIQGINSHIMDLIVPPSFRLLRP
jgi:hypothetical protein